MSRETAQQALDRAFMEQRPSLVARIARLVGNMATAEELAQEAYLRASAALKETRIASPKAYFGSTAWNLAIDYLRRQRR
ncbi:MAG: sigma factor, partial [Pseudomonadota bacterium]